MRKILLFTISLFLVTSCSSDGDVQPTVCPEEVTGRFYDKPFKWDEEYSTFKADRSDIKIQYDLFSEKVAASDLSNGLEKELILRNLSGVYLSGTYPISSFKKGLLTTEFNNAKNTLSLFFQSDLIIYVTRWYENMGMSHYGNVLAEVVASLGYKNHIKRSTSNGTSYQMVELYTYADIDKVFGGGVGPRKFFSYQMDRSKKAIEKKSLTFISLAKLNLYAFTDVPADGLFKKSEYNKQDGYAYIRSLSYGSIAYALIESEHDYSSVATAFQVALSYEFDIEKMLADGRNNFIDILSSSKIVFYGLDGNPQANIAVDDLSAITDYFSAKYTEESLGIPIHMQLKTVKDNAIFIP